MAEADGGRVGYAERAAPTVRTGALIERHRELAVLEEAVRDAAVGRAALSLHSNCHCNPGVREVALSSFTQELAAAFRDKSRLRFEEFLHVIDGKTTRAARASLGLATTFANVCRFREFAAGFGDVPSGAVKGLSRPAPVPAAWGISGRGTRRERPPQGEG